MKRSDLRKLIRKEQILLEKQESTITKSEISEIFKQYNLNLGFPWGATVGTEVIDWDFYYHKVKYKDSDLKKFEDIIKKKYPHKYTIEASSTQATITIKRNTEASELNESENKLTKSELEKLVAGGVQNYYKVFEAGLKRMGVNSIWELKDQPLRDFWQWVNNVWNNKIIVESKHKKLYKIISETFKQEFKNEKIK